MEGAFFSLSHKTEKEKKSPTIPGPDGRQMNRRVGLRIG